MSEWAGSYIRPNILFSCKVSSQRTHGEIITSSLRQNDDDRTVETPDKFQCDKKTLNNSREFNTFLYISARNYGGLLRCYNESFQENCPSSQVAELAGVFTTTSHLVTLWDYLKVCPIDFGQSGKDAYAWANKISRDLKLIFETHLKSRKISPTYEFA